MVYWVYILYSHRDHKLYVGCTSDLEKRIAAHNTGKVDATRERQPLSLVHSEQFNDKAEAFDRERFLKSLWSARFKKRVLRQYFENRKSD